MSNCNHNCHASSSVQQSLNELEFERGIWSAAQTNDIDRIKILINKGEDVNRVDAAGYTALHYAARNGCLDACKLLHRNGADLNAVTRAGRATALHRAVSNGKIDVIRFLLEKGANAHMQDLDGKTILHRAAENKRHEIYELLNNTLPDLNSIFDNKKNLPIDYL